MSYSIAEDWGNLCKIRSKVHKALEKEYKDRYVLLTINISPAIHPDIVVEYMIKDVNSPMSSKKLYYREVFSVEELNKEFIDKYKSDFKRKKILFWRK